MLSTKSKEKIDYWQNYRKEVIRDDWDTHFMDIAVKVSKRSLDNRTHCGAVLVRDNTIISTGYNSFIRDIDDNVLPNVEPEKYPFMIHAEHNAVLNCAREGKPTKGVTCYVTGPTCNNCLQILWQAGVKEIVYGDNIPNMCKTDDWIITNEILLYLMGGRLIYRKFSPCPN